MENPPFWGGRYYCDGLIHCHSISASHCRAVFWLSSTALGSIVKDTERGPCCDLCLESNQVGAYGLIRKNRHVEFTIIPSPILARKAGPRREKILINRKKHNARGLLPIFVRMGSSDVVDRRHDNRNGHRRPPSSEFHLTITWLFQFLL